MSGININAFREVAGASNSIGYAVLNREGTGLEKAAAHRHLTERNVMPAATSEDHASVRYMLYNAVREGLSGMRNVGAALDLIRRELGVTENDGVLTFANTPLERRSIRAVLRVFDSVRAGAAGDGLTKKEAVLAGLFGMADFTNEKTPAPELYRFASSLHDVMSGKTLVERVTLNGTSATVCRCGDGKVGVFFGSGYREFKLNPNFFRGVQKNAFAHFDAFTKASLRQMLNTFKNKVEKGPLSAEAQHVRELCRSMILAKFPAGVDTVRLDNLSPGSVLRLADDIARGAISKPQTLMQAVGQYDGQLNALTGEERVPGEQNVLGGTMDQNINSQENDYLVERFLKFSEEEQNSVQFADEYVQPLKTSKTLTKDEVARVLGKYAKEQFWDKAANVANNVVSSFVSFFSSAVFSNDDVEALTKMLGKSEEAPPKEEKGFLSILAKGFKGFFVQSDEQAEQVEEPKQPEPKPAEEPKQQEPKQVEPPKDTLFEISVDDGKGGKEPKFVTDSNLETVVRLLCEAGENDENLNELKGGLSVRAKAFVNAFRADPRLEPLLANCRHGQEKDLKKGILSLFRPFADEAGEKLKMALDAVDDDVKVWTRDDLAIFTLSNKSNATVLAQLLSVRAGGLFDLAKLDPALAPKAQKLLALFDGLKPEYADKAGRKHPLSDLCDNPRELEREIRKLGSCALNERDIVEIRAAFADLLQDANTWESDKRNGQHGGRLAYSLNKNAEAMAMFLCNRHQIDVFGFPAIAIGKALVELLDKLPQELVDDVFVPGNEVAAAQTLRVMLTQPSFTDSLKDAEKMIDERTEVKCKEMQVVISSQFTAMLSGSGDEVDADKIQDSFVWLRELLAITPAGTAAKDDVSRQCDVAIDFLKGLQGRDVHEFAKVFKRVYPGVEPDAEDADGEVLLAHLNEVRSMLNKLSTCAVSSVDQLFEAHDLLVATQLQGMGGDKDFAAEQPVTIQDTVSRIISRMPAGTTVDDLRQAIEAVRIENPGDGAMTVLDGAVELLHKAPLPNGATFADLLAVARTLASRPGGEGENAPVRAIDVLKRLPEGRCAADFCKVFKSERLGKGDVAETFVALGKIKPGMAVADVEAFVTGGATIEEAVGRLEYLPADKTVDDIRILTGALGCNEMDAMKVLRKVDRGLTTKVIAETLKRIIELGGKEGENNRISIDDALKILMCGNKSSCFHNTLKSFEKNLEQTDWKRVGMPKPSDWETLLMVIQLASGFKGLRKSIDAVACRQNGEEALTPAALERVLTKLNKPADVEIEVNGVRVRRAFKPTVRKLNTQFPADARYHVLVHMLRENGMNAEADEIDVVVEDPPPGDTNESHQEAVKKMRAKIQDLRMTYSRRLLGKLGTSATDVTKGYGKFMCEVMNNYFASVSTLDKRSMLSAAIRYATGEDQMALLGAALKGAGPIMQKMLQGLASIPGLPKSFLDALSDMRSNLADIPQPIVRAQLHELVLQSNGKIESIRVVKPLGAASVGQAFLCEMKMAGEEKPRSVVVKMLRPDAMPRAQREKEIFRKCARNVEGMEKTFEGQLKGIMDELDLSIEAGNVIAGKVYGEGNDNIGSMQLIDGVPILKSVMIVECAPGTTVDRYINDTRKKLDDILSPFRKKDGGGYELEAKGNDFLERTNTFADTMQKLAQLYKNAREQQENLVAFAKKWADEGIYNGGFYHGDLHAGNIMVADSRVDETGTEKPAKLTVIDFGNATQLTKDQQKAVIRMMTAATFKDTNRFLDNFAELMSPEGRADFAANRNKGKRLHDVVHDILNLGDQRSAPERIFAILQQLMLLGYEMPAAVYNFSQCTLRLQGTIDQMTAAVENIRNEMIEFAKCKTNVTADDQERFMSGNPLISFLVKTVRGKVASENPSQLDRLEKNCGDREGIKDRLVSTFLGLFKKGPKALEKMAKMFDDFATVLPDGATVVEGEGKDAKTRKIKSGVQIKADAAVLLNKLKGFFMPVIDVSPLFEAKEPEGQELEEDGYAIFEGLNRIVERRLRYKSELQQAETDLEAIVRPIDDYKRMQAFTPVLLKSIRNGVEVTTMLRNLSQKLEGGGRPTPEEQELGDLEKVQDLIRANEDVFRLGLGVNAQQELEGKDLDELEVFRHEADNLAEKIKVFKRRNDEDETERSRLSNLIEAKAEEFKPVIETFVDDFADFFLEGVYKPLAKKLQAESADEENAALDDFFSAIGDTISSHINKDLFNLDFSSAKEGLFSVGKLVKSVPSIVENLNRFGVGLVYKTAVDQTQIPV